MFKVADLKQLSLGNTNYVVTKVCRRISRSLSGMHQASNTGTPDALAAAAAALEPLAFTPTGARGGACASHPQLPAWLLCLLLFCIDTCSSRELVQLQSALLTLPH